jgi:glycine/D-amino acid oxidase-like deaminating enzyme
MRIVIIGAGFGSIGAAIELMRHGFHDIGAVPQGGTPLASEGFDLVTRP